MPTSFVKSERRIKDEALYKLINSSLSGKSKKKAAGAGAGAGAAVSDFGVGVGGLLLVSLLFWLILDFVSHIPFFFQAPAATPAASS